MSAWSVSSVKLFCAVAVGDSSEKSAVANAAKGRLAALANDASVRPCVSVEPTAPLTVCTKASAPFVPVFSTPSQRNAAQPQPVRVVPKLIEQVPLPPLDALARQREILT